MGNTGGRQCWELVTAHIQYFPRRVVGMAELGPGGDDKNKWNSFQYFTRTEAGQWVTSVELFTRKLLSSSSSRPHHHHCKDSEQLLTALTSFPRSEQCSLHYLHSASACTSCGADDRANKEICLPHSTHFISSIFSQRLYLQNVDISFAPELRQQRLHLFALSGDCDSYCIYYIYDIHKNNQKTVCSLGLAAAKTRLHTLYRSTRKN